MKFSSSLKFNAVSEWWDEYIDYDNLKKKIYQLEKEQQTVSGPYNDLESNERTSLVGQHLQKSTDDVFIPLLDKELKKMKITLFYQSQEEELERLEKLEEEVTKQEEQGLEGDHYQDDFEDDEDDDENISRSPVGRRASVSSGRRRIFPTTSRNYPLIDNTDPDNTIHEGEPLSPRQHRHSISSSEGEGDMEDSIASLRGRGSAFRGPLGRLVNMMKSVSSSRLVLYDARLDLDGEIQLCL